MNLIKHYILILRPTNILISFATVFICADMVNTTEEMFVVFYTALIIGAFIGGSNVFNDIQDLKADKINHPERSIPSGSITIKNAKIYTIILWVLGCFMCLWLPISATLTVYIIALPLAFFYSKKIKGMYIIGNVVIGFLLGLIFIFCGIVFGNVRSLIIPACLAFSLTFVRELIKDIEDIDGDRKAGLNTFPVKVGIKKAVNLVILLSFLTGLISLIPYFINFYSTSYLILLILGVELPLAIVVFLFMKSPSRITAKKSSLLLKIATMMGILSIYAGAKIGN